MFKKCIRILGFMFLLLSSHTNINSQSSWDSKTFMYKNYDYSFAWEFPSFCNWEQVATLEKHTIFKVRQPDLGIVVYINVNDTQVKDYWEQYDIFLTLMEKSLETMKKNTGAIISNKSYKKFLLSGKHAVKVRYNFSIKDDRYESPINSSIVSYYYISNKKSYILTLQVPTEVYEYDDFEEVVNEIFKGYHILYSNN